MSGSENKESSASVVQSDDGLSFLDLVMFVRRHGAVLLGGALIGSALGLGLAVAFTLPVQYEASALLQVGKIGNDGTPIESHARVIERVNYGSFEDDVLKRLGISPDESDPKAALLFNNLKVKIENSNLISVRVRGTTPDDAVRFVDAVIAELTSTHAKIAEPILQRLHNEIEESERRLKRLNNEIERLSGLLEKSTREPSPTSVFLEMFASNILVAREAELREVRERKRILQEQLNPERTFPTSSLGRAKSSTLPAYPNKSRFAVSGLVIGLFMAVLLSLWRSYVFVDKKY